MKNPELFAKKNLNSTKNLLLVMEQASLSKLVFSSTTAVYGSALSIVDENSPLYRYLNTGKLNWKKRC
jgi:UDP-glucose 4-epimerase